MTFNRAVPIFVSSLSKQVGRELGPSEWIQVSQIRINTFAKATDDYQFIHVDPSKARETHFGGTIAHGFLILSLIPKIIEQLGFLRSDAVRVVINYGSDKTRFLSPVRSGKRIRGKLIILRLHERKPGRWQLDMEVTIEIEGEDWPALVAEWKVLLILDHATL